MSPGVSCPWGLPLSGLGKSLSWQAFKQRGSSQLCGSIVYSDFFNFYLMSFSIPGSHSKLPHYNLRLLAGTVSQTLLGVLGFDDLEGFEEHWSRVP